MSFWKVFLLNLTLVAALLLALIPLPAIAQEARDAEVEFYVRERPEGVLTVGDQVTLRLEVTHPSASRIVLPQLEREWGPFEVLDQAAPETVNHEDGTATTGKDIVVTLFQPGRFQTPPLVVTHRKPDGSLEELAAPVVQLRVTSVLTEESVLQDLKPQAAMVVPPLWPWIVGGLLLTMFLTGLLAGTGLWVYHRWQKRAAAPALAAPFVDTRPPEVIALSELDRIETLNLPAQNQVKEHYSLVDGCLRRYIEGRYQFPALEQTTGEIRTAFKKSALPIRVIGNFMSLLTESDLVKFARYVPPAEEVDRLIGRARAFIHATTPEPEPLPDTPKREGRA